MVSAPKPPDPVKTAAAQSGSNRDTALSSILLGQTNQVTPDGTLTYNQTGTNSYVDSLTGKTVTVPKFTATTALSPQQQAIKDQTDAASLNLGTLANQQSNFLKDYLAKPFKADTAEAEARLNELGSARLDPRFAKEQDSLRTQLISSGIRPGSAAYDQQMAQLGQTKNDAYNQLYLTGRGQALQEAYAERAQPINEIGSLMGGAQVQQPTFQNTPQANVAGVDYTGLVNQQYQAKVQNQNSMLGGLFGLGAAGIKAIPWSDRRLKENIRRVGTLANGLGVYSYNLIGDAMTQIGLMADEVMQVRPDAVKLQPNGFFKVDYDLALEAA